MPLKMNTISGTYERCQAENIGISKNLIRQLALNGTIPTVLVGKKTHLINYDILMEYLKTGTVTKDKSIENIRQLSEKYIIKWGL